MKVLVLNCGSSSVKYQLFALDGQVEEVLGSGIVEEVGLGSPSLTHRQPGHEKKVWTDLAIGNHKDAIQMVLNVLVDPEYGVLASVQSLEAVGHRVVHAVREHPPGATPQSTQYPGY
jgi:acetate kinase